MPATTERELIVQGAECPTCGAGIGAACVGRYGRQGSRLHHERELAVILRNRIDHGRSTDLAEYWGAPTRRQRKRRNI